MKKLLLTLAIIVAAIFLFLAGVIARTYYIAFYGDEYTETAKRLSPLGRRYTYIIAPNLNRIGGDNGSIIPAGTFYTFYPPGTNLSDEQMLWGRKISNKTTLDLTPYLNQPVHIWGKFEHGVTKLIQESTASMLLSDEVLIIEHLEFARNP